MLSFASASLSFAGLAPTATPSTIKMVATSKPQFAYGARLCPRAPRPPPCLARAHS